MGGVFLEVKRAISFRNLIGNERAGAVKVSPRIIFYWFRRIRAHRAQKVTLEQPCLRAHRFDAHSFKRIECQSGNRNKEHGSSWAKNFKYGRPASRHPERA